MAIEKTELTDNLAYGVDLKNRKIFFGVNIDTATEDHSEFTNISVELAIRALHRMVSDAPGKPIEIHMSSYGGDVYAMLRLHDEILACPCQIKFFGGGPIMSAATWIMAVCDERYLYPNATVMVHELSDSMGGDKHTDLKINTAENTRLMKLLCETYAANSRMPIEFWEDIGQRDVYLTAAEAVSLGLADKVLEPKKRGNLRKMRQNSLKKTPEPGDMRKLINSIYSRINRLKVPKIELNEPVKEPSDPHVVIEKAEMDKPQQPQVEATGVSKEEPTT